jgi:DNA-binding XRE family transcriptional regulator
MMMHYVSFERKHLLHHTARYQRVVESANERLKEARQRAGFDTAVDAARALGIAQSTYIAHENGNRGFPAKRAPIYARKFKVSEEWLLYGKGEAADPLPSEDEIAEILGDIQTQLPASLPYSEWPRAVAAGLRLRLELLLGDRSNADRNGHQA